MNGVVTRDRRRVGDAVLPVAERHRDNAPQELPRDRQVLLGPVGDGDPQDGPDGVGRRRDQLAHVERGGEPARPARAVQHDPAGAGPGERLARFQEVVAVVVHHLAGEVPAVQRRKLDHERPGGCLRLGATARPADTLWA